MATLDAYITTINSSSIIDILTTALCIYRKSIAVLWICDSSPMQ